VTEIALQHAEECCFSMLFFFAQRWKMLPPLAVLLELSSAFHLGETACALDGKRIGFVFHFCMFGFILQPRRRDTRFKPLGSWQHR
jgi:hypothetical protein